MNVNKYTPIDAIKTDFCAQNLLIFTPSEIFSKHPSLYWAVYRFTKKHKKQVSQVWVEIGLNIKRVQSFRSVEECLIWATKKGLIGKSVYEISAKDRSRLRLCAKKEKLALTALYDKLAIKYGYDYAYESVDNIRTDLEVKGLVGKTAGEIATYDGDKTAKNIREFANRHEFIISHLYQLIGIGYSEKTEVVNVKAKTAPTYHTIGDIRADLERKKLVKVSPQEIAAYDFSKTYGNIYKYAIRNDITLSNLWGILGIERQKHIRPVSSLPKISTLSDIKKYLDDNKIQMDLKEFRVHHKVLYGKILLFAKRQKMQKGEIWKQLGLQSGIQFLNSIEDVISLLVKNSLRQATVKEIRLQKSVYNAISQFAKNNNFKISNIWNLLGIKSSYQPVD